MKFSNPYWSPTLRISFLQRYILVHSILYYEMDTSIISDKEFDDNARQLVSLQSEFSEHAAKSDYWYIFYDFDASTGFHLYGRMNKHDKEYLSNIAQHVLAVWEGAHFGNKHKAG